MCMSVGKHKIYFGRGIFGTYIHTAEILLRVLGISSVENKKKRR